MLNKLTMKTRLMLVVAPLTLVLALVGTLGLNGLNNSNASLLEVYEDGVVDLSHLATIDQLMARARGDASRPLYVEEDEVVEQSIQKLNEKIADIQKEYAQFESAGLSGEEKELSLEFGAAMNKYIKEGLEPSIVALKQN